MGLFEYQPKEISREQVITEGRGDALQSPTALGGLLSMDITDYLTPGGLAKILASKSLLFPAIIKDMPTPKWNDMRGMPSVPVGINPTKSELRELATDQQTTNGFLRKIDVKNDAAYLWPTDAALHYDVMKHFNLDPSKVKFGHKETK